MEDLNYKLSWGLVQLGYNVPDNYACSNQATYADVIETWEHSDVIPNEHGILDAYNIWVIEQEKIKYKKDRKFNYPTVGDQLDMLWHAIDTGDWTAAKVKTTDFYTKLKKVKDDNPKPS